MSSFSIPLSGLKASSEALNTIANNLSNMNTTAFKSQSVSFSDLFYQQIGTTGSGNPLQVGAGTQVGSTETDFTQGGVQETGSNSDVYLNGNGFFVVQDGNLTEYTRAGNFTQSSDGHLVTQDGQNVMGYPVVNGVVDTNAPLAPIVIPANAVEQPQATTSLSLTANLDASSAVGTTVPAQVTLYDSLGVAHVATINFTNQGSGNWSYNISLPDTLAAGSTTDSSVTPPVTTNSYTFAQSGGSTGTVDPSTSLTISGDTASGTASIVAPTVTAGESLSDYASALSSALSAAGILSSSASVSVTGGNTLAISGASFSTSGSVVQEPVATNASGTLSFNGNGNLISPVGNLSGITFTGLSDGATPLDFSWNLYGASNQPSISQVAEASGVSGTDQNGYAGGQSNGFSIDSSGIISATFTNGMTTPVGQLALANVTNPQGLVLAAGNNYQTTLASGSASIGVAGSAGLGTIQDAALEASNVDISTQFSNLIVEQQAFDASSKAITTFDTISQDTLNMIH
ncbi:MAG TPA: flagellar hook-basal body complex protein [Acidobacteriaceae bacterium]|jgi:flagellar hook protein FlgE|nr:flagellar hook-basal body complex protein [Acidobacteriaceae bacterium]